MQNSTRTIMVATMTRTGLMKWVWTLSHDMKFIMSNLGRDCRT